MTLEDYLATGTTFKQIPNGVEGYYTLNGAVVSVTYTNDELNQLHPRLSGAVETMFSLLHSKSDLVSAYWVDDTLKYWRENLTLRDYYGDEMPIAEISELVDFDATKNSIWLEATCFNIGTYENLGIAVGKKKCVIHISCAELDKHFPDWKSKYDALTAIGVQGRELVSSVLVREPTPTYPLAQLTLPQELTS